MPLFANEWEGEMSGDCSQEPGDLPVEYAHNPSRKRSGLPEHGRPCAKSLALHTPRPDLFQVDLHCTRGDNERCNNMEVTTRCSPVSHLTVSHLYCCCRA